MTDKPKKKKRILCPNDPEHEVSGWDGRYDSFACTTCDIWTEPMCSCEESECEFKSRKRPERPSMATPYRNWYERFCTCGHLGKTHTKNNAVCILEGCSCEGYNDEDDSYNTGPSFVGDAYDAEILD
jgi:hypothetical protein